MIGKSLNGKKIAIVIAFREFRDIEYFIPRNVLAGAGAKIVTVSSQKGIAVGADGGEAQVNLLVSEVNIEEGRFDAIIFIGGSGMGKNLDNPDFQRIAKEAVEKDKVLGAICVAPALLAKADILKGKKATVWSNQLDKSAIKILTEGGAEYIADDVVIDGKLITAVGPLAAKKFGEALVDVLTKN